MMAWGLNERRALRVAHMSASAFRYAPRPDRNVELRRRIVTLAHRHKRYGVGRIYLKLRQAGVLVNYKRVEQLYQDAALQVRRRKRKKVPIGDRQPLAVEVERGISGCGAARVLDRLVLSRGLPRVLHTDNGKEFCGRAMLDWAHAKGVTLRLIEPGKPNQNAYIERFNGRLRGECLNERWFPNLLQARAVIETWRFEYNEGRPKKALGGMTPEAYA